MKEYEVVHEIFNECANNQMRDVFFEEVALDDPEQYIRSRQDRAGRPGGWNHCLSCGDFRDRAEIYLHGDLRAKRKGLAALIF